MTALRCGCLVNPSKFDDYCPDHRTMACHGGRDIGVLCPPCRIAKWRSVSLSSAATPTRGKA